MIFTPKGEKYLSGVKKRFEERQYLTEKEFVFYFMVAEGGPLEFLFNWRNKKMFESPERMNTLLGYMGEFEEEGFIESV